MNRRELLFSVRDQHLDRDLAEALPSFEESELDQEFRRNHGAAEALKKLDGRARGSARGEQIVDQSDAGAGRNRVLVNLDGVGAVFQRVGFLARLPRQLVRLANGN